MDSWKNWVIADPCFFISDRAWEKVCYYAFLHIPRSKMTDSNLWNKQFAIQLRKYMTRELKADGDSLQIEFVSDGVHDVVVDSQWKQQGTQVLVKSGVIMVMPSKILRRKTWKECKDKSNIERIFTRHPVAPEFVIIKGEEE